MDIAILERASSVVFNMAAIGCSLVVIVVTYRLLARQWPSLGSLGYMLLGCAAGTVIGEAVKAEPEDRFFIAQQVVAFTCAIFMTGILLQWPLVVRRKWTVLLATAVLLGVMQGMSGEWPTLELMGTFALGYTLARLTPKE